MIKYCITAMALRFFSCSNFTKWIYRGLGNTFGRRKRVRNQIPGYYLERINHMLRIATRYGFPKNGDRLIELGTGWVHWEAITTRLFFDVHGILFDVWDNRHLDGLKYYIIQLDNYLKNIDIDDSQKIRAHNLISKIIKVSNYNDLYDLLGFEYIIDRSGRLDLLKKEAFDIVVSAGVLEHIYKNCVPTFIHGIAGLLKPGGYSIHSINMRDHLYQYDTSVSQKQYLRYPPWVWKLCFENDVQYINKLQRSEWLDLFSKAGLTLIEEEIEMEKLSGLKIASINKKKYKKSDLQCGGLKLIHRKSTYP